MKRRPNLHPAGGDAAASVSDPDTILQLKVWLVGISPMVWRRVLVSASCSLRELHGVFQVAMGWEGIHLYQFHLRAVRYGSLELCATVLHTPARNLEMCR